MIEYEIIIKKLTPNPESKYPDTKEIYNQVIEVSEDQKAVMVENIIKAVNNI